MSDTVMTERAPDRLEVLARIAAYECEGIFDRDVENDPPTVPLDWRRVDYLGKRLSTRIGTAVANRVATAYYERLIRRGIFRQRLGAYG